LLVFADPGPIQLVAISKVDPGAKIQELIGMGKELLTQIGEIGGKGTKNGKAAAALAAVSSVVTPKDPRPATDLKEVERQLTGSCFFFFFFLP
jgi:hypothetical protein